MTDDEIDRIERTIDPFLSASSHATRKAVVEQAIANEKAMNNPLPDCACNKLTPERANDITSQGLVYFTLKCRMCNHDLIASPATNKHVTEGLMRPICFDCAAITPHTHTGMTSGQIADMQELIRRTERSRAESN